MMNELYRSIGAALVGNTGGIHENFRGLIYANGRGSVLVDMTRANELTMSVAAPATFQQNLGYIDMLRARAVVLKAGARVKPVSGSAAYTRLTSSVDASLRGELGVVSNSKPGFEKVAYTPKALVASCHITDESELMAGGGLEQLVKTDIISQFALQMDKLALIGNASPAVVGLLSAGSGIYDKDLATAAKPTFATVNLLKSAVDAKAVNLDACTWITTPDLMGLMETTPKFTNGSVGIVDADKLNGKQIYSTSHCPVDTLNHTLLFGDFSQLEIALFGAVEFNLNIDTYFAEGVKVLTAKQHIDIGILQPAAFAKCSNFLAA